MVISESSLCIGRRADRADATVADSKGERSAWITRPNRCGSCSSSRTYRASLSRAAAPTGTTWSSSGSMVPRIA